MSDNVPELRVVGYTDRPNYHAGDQISVYVSALGRDVAYRPKVVELVCASSDIKGPGLQERETSFAMLQPKVATQQATLTGSFIQTSFTPSPDVSFYSLGAIMKPSKPMNRRQALLSTLRADDGTGLSLYLNEDGYLCLRIATDAVVIDHQGPFVEVGEWQLAAAEIDVAADTITLRTSRAGVNSTRSRPADMRVTNMGAERFEFFGTDLRIAADHCASGPSEDGTNCFDGKLEAPAIFYRRLTVVEWLKWEQGQPPADAAACWDFSIGMKTSIVTDISGNGHPGRCMQLPARAVTGARWTGTCHSWELHPEQYAAIKFHSDDQFDCGWDVSFEIEIPEDCPSSVYAIKLENASVPEYIVFFVSPSEGERCQDVVYLASTANYLAYANWGLFDRLEYFEPARGRLTCAGPEDVALYCNPRFQKSAYDYHKDRSGIRYSSWRRPIFNLRPDTRLSSFSGDSFVLSWLDAIGQAHDVVTDHDLHQRGAHALDGCKVLITGCHPEYWSTPMVAALQAFQESGGSLMYLGANGMYWRIAFSEEWPNAIEVRRSQGGSGAWKSEPGEDCLAFTGETGGIWRNNGAACYRLLGVGTTAMGFDFATPFYRNPASYDGRANFIFEGVKGEVIGDFGIGFGGAAGQEIDRWDPDLGSPKHALVLASSKGHSDNMLGVLEDFVNTTLAAGGTMNAKVRADMVFFETGFGGAVFSTSSICWPSALPINGFDNDVATITTNVLKRFLKPEKFDLP
ncbi:N,N-dimethylformamidase beta subunit family domain-containing protein [Mesorhizobium sp. B4-1-4]|uniref:N,N-dimethylformamidase beta subunit family domain-containing protein n=1 Tax=Mesorhizobium sp. B4-1-4 TaxID=2589888 RepID=UPI00112E22E2|nr:N,N-dimethylformamidase beta subunit family domain-containing protein [Mesorhizobium sp. B4-1-4]UCI31901.1 hypothetical protein FJW03_29920 [Mesorhizobium sp. B4-1-4]